MKDAYGQVSGPYFDIIQDLADEGHFLNSFDHALKREDLEWTARDLFKAIGDNILDANINYEYALKDAVKAHEAIESGTTIGATVLMSNKLLS